MSCTPVVSTNVVVRMVRAVTLAGAVLVSVSPSTESFLRAQSTPPVTPTNVRLPDESGGVAAIARTLTTVFAGAKSIIPDFRKFDRALKTTVRPVLVSLQRTPFRDFSAEEFLGRSLIRCKPAVAVAQPKGQAPSAPRWVDASDTCASVFEGSKITLGQLADAMVYVGPQAEVAPRAAPTR